MSLSQELLLALLLFGLYLHDSFALSPSGASFLVWTPSGWRPHFSARSFTLAGRPVFLAPFLPLATPIYRLEWQPRSSFSDSIPKWDSSVRHLLPLSLAGAASFVLVIMCVPIALLAHLSETVLLMILILGYASAVAAAATLWFSRARLELRTAWCAKLIAEMLLCPPIAANVARRVSLQVQVDEGFVSAARRLLPESHWAEARDELELRINAEMECCEEDSAEFRSLRDLKAGLQ